MIPLHVQTSGACAAVTKTGFWEESHLAVVAGPGQLLHSGGWGGSASSPVLPGGCGLQVFGRSRQQQGLLPALRLPAPETSMPHLGHAVE